jgi:hypothetical protein
VTRSIKILKRLLDNKRQNRTTLLLQTSSVFLQREQFTRTGVLQQHCAVFHFQMPLEKSIIFLNHRNGFLNVMFCGVCFSFSKKSLESYSYFVKIEVIFLAATTALHISWIC